MKHFCKFLIAITSVFMTSTSLGAPSPLIVDKKQKPMASAGHIAAVHQEIENPHKSAKMARLAILRGMYFNRGIAWLMENEGPGFVTARFDYKGDTIIIRAEYNDDLIQLKYIDGNDGYECENLVEGICYENNRGYYNYTKNLRRSIIKYL